MKKRVYSMVIGAALSLATVSVSHAMSEFVSLSVKPEWPATSTPGNVVVYKVDAVVRAGSGLLEVSLSALDLPAGATVEFSPSVLRFTGNDPVTQTAIMTVTCTEPTSVDSYPFTVTGKALRESITFTNQVVQQKLIADRPELALDRLKDGSLKLRGTGFSAQTYEIQASRRLDKPGWASVGSTTADGNGRFTFFPGRESYPSMQFYRTVNPAP
jgi:hypothetical protein